MAAPRSGPASTAASCRSCGSRFGFDDTTGGRLDRRVDELADLAARTRELGAPLTIRVSPTSGSVATYALETVLARLADDVWVGGAGAYAASFSARYGLQLEVTADQETAALAIHLAGGGRVPSQTLILPSPAASATYGPAARGSRSRPTDAGSRCPRSRIPSTSTSLRAESDKPRA